MLPKSTNLVMFVDEAIARKDTAVWSRDRHVSLLTMSREVDRIESNAAISIPNFGILVSSKSQFCSKT